LWFVGNISHFVRDDKPIKGGKTMADSKTPPKRSVALPKKIIVIGCED
jgi:hypothetical protein